MAATVTTSITRQSVVGNKRWHPSVVTFDSSYPTGGYAVTAKQFGLVSVERLIMEGAVYKTADGTSGFVARYNRSTAKIQVFKANGTTNLLEVTSTTDLSAYSVDVLAVGF